MNEFYVYVILHPVSNNPIYVGKGKKFRAFSHISTRRKSYVSNKIFQIKRETGLDPIVQFHLKDLTESQAFEEERNLIKLYGRKDNGTGILYNLSDGGEGPANRILSDDHRRKLSEANKGKTISTEAKKKISDSMKQRIHTWGYKISESLTGIPLTNERKQKISESRKRYYQEHPEAKVAFNKGVPHTEESKQKMSDSLKIALSTPEAKANRSAANSGGNNPRAKRCKYGDQEFSCISEAERSLGIYKAKLKRDPLFSFI